MDNESSKSSNFKEVEIKRNFLSVPEKKINPSKEDSVFLGEENMKKVLNFHK